MKKGDIEKKYKKFKRWGIFFTILGLLFVCGGFFRYFFGKHSYGLHINTFLPIFKDGSFSIVVGLALVAIGAYRLIFKKNAFYESREIANEKELKEYEDYLKSIGCGQKEMKRRMKILRKKISK